MRTRPMSEALRRKAGLEWGRELRFRGLMARFRPIRSEVEFLSRLRVGDRRARLQNEIVTRFHFRKRGQYVPPMTFGKSGSNI